MKKLILIAAGGLSFFFLLIITGALLIAPGSYPYAEPYIINIPYDEIDSTVIKLKQTYPELQDYIVTEDGDSIPVKDNNKFIKFYLPNTKYSVSCRTRGLDNPRQTRITLVHALDVINNTGYKSINTKELSKEDNKKIKKEFETEVLDKLGKWDHETPGFLRFLGFP